MKKEYETIILSSEEGVGTITLNRPEALNAMSPKLLEELEVVMDEVASDRDIRAVILTGAGRAFCAGGDIEKDIAYASSLKPLELQAYIHTTLFRKLAEIEKPMIAAINGHAVGAGFDICLACDIRFAAENARLSGGFVRVGLIPDAGGAYFLPRLVGLSKAKLLEFTGDFIDASEAERIGLVDKVFPADELMSAVRELAQRLASGPTKAIALIKKALNKSYGMDLATSLEYTGNLQCLLLQSEDVQEAIQAFREKRKPIFKS